MTRCENIKHNIQKCWQHSTLKSIDYLPSWLHASLDLCLIPPTPGHFQCFIPYQRAILALATNFHKHLLQVHKTQRNSIWPQCALQLLFSSSKPCTSDIWPQFLTWPLKVPISPARVAVICGLLGDSYQVTLEVHRLQLNLACSWTPPRTIPLGPTRPTT